MKTEAIYKLYKDDKLIYEGRLESKEIKALKANGHQVVKTDSYVKSNKF